MELTVLILLKFLKCILSRVLVFTDLRWPSCKSVITKYSGVTCRFRLNHCQNPCVYLCASLCVHLHLYHYVCLCAQSLSSVQLVVTPWGVACKAPVSLEFSRSEYWSGLPFPTTGDPPDPEIEPMFLASPAVKGGCCTTVQAGNPIFVTGVSFLICISWKIASTSQQQYKFLAVIPSLVTLEAIKKQNIKETDNWLSMWIVYSFA